jgi:hypothetical protein
VIVAASVGQAFTPVWAEAVPSPTPWAWANTASLDRAEALPYGAVATRRQETREDRGHARKPGAGAYLTGMDRTYSLW